MIKTILKKVPLVKKVYANFISITRAYLPTCSANYEYFIAYGKKCNLTTPKTFSEKLLWLKLHTYSNNPLILKLCDKYLVREFVTERIGEKYLNDLYSVYESIDDIKYEDLPESFALKMSQGCTTNIFCESKKKFDKGLFYNILNEWKQGHFFYDKFLATVGGIPVKELKKYYVCEKFLREEGKKSPTDYKIYCFQGEPKAILVISDRFENINGAFMSPKWEYLGELTGSKYHKPSNVFKKPKSLEVMIEAARKLSQGFPFVRVDMYDINGKAIFGEMTFFPNGCIHMQEIAVDGKSMGEMLDISQLLKK